MRKSYSLLSGLILSVICINLSFALEPDSESDRFNRAANDVGFELAQIEQEINIERARLLRAESTLPTSEITPALLEDVRLEHVSVASRERGLLTRLSARRTLHQQISADINELESKIERSEQSSAELNQWQGQLLTLEGRRTQLNDLILKLEKLHARYEVKASLARQHLNLLQSRFELPDLGAMRQSLGETGKALQSDIDRLLAKASQSRRDRSQFTQATPAARAKKRYFELEALVAEERAEMKQMEIVRLQINRVLQSLATLSSSGTTIERVMVAARENVEKMQVEIARQLMLLNQKHAQFTDQQSIIKQQGAIASGADSTFSERQSLIADLIAETEANVDMAQSLELTIDDIHASYVKAITSNASKELFKQRELPSDAETWQQLTRSLASLPIRVAASFKQAILNLHRTFNKAAVGTKLTCIFLLLFLAIAGWQLRRLLANKLQQVKMSANEDETAAWVPLAIFHKNLPSLLLPVLIFALGYLLELRETDLILLLAPIVIWPVVRFSLDFINNLLDEYTPELDKKKTRILIIETRCVVIFTTVLAAILVAAHSVALSPTVIDIIDRLSMVCLLLISVPMIHLRMLLLEGMKGDVESRLIRGVTLAIPIVLIVCALIGITGYVNLALAIAVRLGWLVIVGLGLHLVNNVLCVVKSSIVKWFERKDAESSPYWDKYILGPFYRVTLLLVMIASAQLLFHLFNWNEQTPIVSAIPIMLDSTLFNIGDAAIKLKTLLLAVLVLFVAVWGAGWSKQVSHRWLFIKVQDQGIRNSLATFTQYIVVILGLVAAMKIIGLDLTALTVFAGALGVGIGFGMQQIVVNFISGILLLVERPLSTTDLVNVDKYEGEVTRIGIRSLTVKTFDNQEVIIPNSSVITKPFTNWTRSDDVMRTVLMVGISYDDDPHKAIDIVKKQLSEHSAILKDPGYKVLLWDYGDSALMIRMQFHTRIRGEIGRADVRSQILLGIWDAFKIAGITIPYPQRDIHLHNEVV